MKQPHHPAVRTLLREHTDGLTIAQIMRALPAINRQQTADKVLRNMPDAYIDRWVDPKRGQWQAVWCVVVPPPNCPYPTREHKARTVWQPHARA